MKKILLLLLLFVNLQITFTDGDIELCSFSTAVAQRMYTEGDSSSDFTECSYCGEQFGCIGACSFHELTCSQNPFYNSSNSEGSTNSGSIGHSDNHIYIYQYDNTEVSVGIDRNPIWDEISHIGDDIYIILYFREGVYMAPFSGQLEKELVKLSYYRNKIPLSSYWKIEQFWRNLISNL